MRTRLVIVAGFWVLVCLGCVNGEEWPQFRGPGNTGVSTEKPFPLEWSTDKNLGWKVHLPGMAWSSPIVWGDKIFLTTASTDKQTRPARDGGFGGPGGPGGPGGFGGGRVPNVVYRWSVYCLDRASGKVLWSQVAQEGKPRTAIQQSNTYATETPATDGERIYAYFGMTGMFCYDFNGKLLWKKDLGAYQTSMGHGSASSPALDGQRLFIQVDNEEKSFLVALDGKTGEELWRVTREERTNHSSPVIWKNKMRTELVTAGNKVRSYDPATGKVLWELSMGGGRCSASPVGDDEHLYVGAGAGGPGGGGRGGPGGFGGPGGPGGPGGGRGAGSGGALYAVNAGASGDVSLKQGQTSNAGVAWSQARAGVENASPLALQGYLYVLGQRGGFVSCYDGNTGKQVYRERLPNARSFWASPWACDGKVFCLDDSGTTYILQAGPAFKLLGQNHLDDQFWASPAVVGGSLILRGVDNVYCIKP
jgi:outer membrane protein assembly factor BamB